MSCSSRYSGNVPHLPHNQPLHSHVGSPTCLSWQHICIFNPSKLGVAWLLWMVALTYRELNSSFRTCHQSTLEEQQQALKNSGCWYGAWLLSWVDSSCKVRSSEWYWMLCRIRLLLVFCRGMLTTKEMMFVGISFNLHFKNTSVHLKCCLVCYVVKSWSLSLKTVWEDL